MILELAYGILSLAFSLLVPGYFFCLGFFPQKGDIDGLERLAFSLVFSITLLPLLVLFENILLNVRIVFATVAANMALIILCSLLLYFVRTKKVPFPGLFYKFVPAVPKGEEFPVIPVK